MKFAGCSKKPDPAPPATAQAPCPQPAVCNPAQPRVPEHMAGVQFPQAAGHPHALPSLQPLQQPVQPHLPPQTWVQDQPAVQQPPQPPVHQAQRAHPLPAPSSPWACQPGHPVPPCSSQPPGQTAPLPLPDLSTLPPAQPAMPVQQQHQVQGGQAPVQQQAAVSPLQQDQGPLTVSQMELCDRPTRPLPPRPPQPPLQPALQPAAPQQMQQPADRAAGCSVHPSVAAASKVKPRDIPPPPAGYDAFMIGDICGVGDWVQPVVQDKFPEPLHQQYHFYLGDSESGMCWAYVQVLGKVSGDFILEMQKWSAPREPDGLQHFLRVRPWSKHQPRKY